MSNLQNHALNIFNPISNLFLLSHYHHSSLAFVLKCEYITTIHLTSVKGRTVGRKGGGV